jgi:hypothetical protein
MKKPEILIIGLSLLGTSIISILLALAASTLIGTFWSWFIIIFVLQIVGFSVFNSILIQRQSNFLIATELAELEQLSKFSIKLSCAYCNQPNDCQIQLNQKNSFKCESCNQVNGVYMQFTATTQTTPIQSVTLPLPDSDRAEIKVSW